MTRRPLAALLALSVLSLAPHVRQDPAPGLAADGRVGTVLDRQGTALVRPVGRQRWTPLRQRSLLLPGDQVRTPVRGANAVEIELADGGRLLLGPGGLIEVGEAAVQLQRGELEVRGRPGAAVRVEGAGGFALAVEKTAVLRAGADAVAELAQPPRWLTGYRASTTDEWMGSLLAHVDGREVPLSVGYHHVEAVIRDQIAQTTVEQSFVNATHRRLEGVFWFPLPADASVSGFAMWVGDELVEADIVEKQRARAIYETILRERRDPGLLEWSGGNLFKARVFPIEPQSEKRIRIRYTQVLPREGSKVRYRYALRSELLRQRPLRELRIVVSLASAVPLATVSSPTHSVRVRQTEHAATLELDADEYTPDRDFEAVCELAGAPALTAVPHRRGADGYFMLLLGAPGEEGPMQRTLVPERGPLDVVVLADTSGSMDPAARETQSAFVGGLLGLLGKGDRFALLACDTAVHRFRPDLAPAGDDEVAAALAFLDARPSLGWTDLDAAFAAVRARAGARTLVVYVGDGIGTAGDGDRVALAQRLRSVDTGGSAWHAVSTASTYEKGVLEAIASHGGSVRAADADPAEAAYALLAEAAQPAITDLRVAFRGLRTARVYPEPLPNLAAGAQRVVLGRFLPSEAEQRGEVIVTGTRDGAPVRYRAPLLLPADEPGNSFLPRLWARRHLDALLARGELRAVQDEIIALSEEFDIMTPLTSFLVLESDEDRERFGVARRVKMRDGERFFAEGRDRAATELLQQQMRRARSWRLQLRAQMLAEIAGLGRDLYGWSVGWGEVDFDGQRGAARELGALGNERRLEPQGAPFEAKEGNEESELLAGAPADEAAGEPEEERARPDDLAFHDDVPAPSSPAPVQEKVVSPARAALGGRQSARDRLGARKDEAYRRAWIDPAPFRALGFPDLGGAPAVQTPGQGPSWDAEIVALLRALDRRPALSRLEGGLLLEAESGARHPLRGTELDRTRVRCLLAASSWHVESAPRGGQVVEQWLADGRRGALAGALRLGRSRPAEAGDAGQWPLPLHDFSTSDLRQGYATYAAEIAARDGDRITVVLRAPLPQRAHVVLTIDRARSVVLRSESFHDGVRTGASVLTGHVRAAGLWWPQRLERHDGEGRLVQVATQRVTALAAGELEARLAARLAAHRDVLFAPGQDPDLARAKQAVHDGDADFAQQLRVVLHFAAAQQHEQAHELWERAAAQGRGAPGVTWIGAWLLQQGRRGEELQALLRATAAQVALDPGPHAAFRAQTLLALGAPVLHADEQLALWQALRPVLAAEAWSRRVWATTAARLMQQAGRPAEAHAVLAAAFADSPDDPELVAEQLRALIGAGMLDDAAAFAADATQQADRWLDHEAAEVFRLWADALWARHRIDDLLPALERWSVRAPADEQAYLRWLSALLYQDREADADAWMRARFAADLDVGDPAQRARLGAAIQLALGQGHGFWARTIDPKWHEPLAALAHALALREHGHVSLAQRIVQDWRFRQTDAFGALCGRLRADLGAELGTMELPQLARWLGWLPWSRTAVAPDLFARIAAGLAARWQSTADAGEREQLAALLAALLDAHGESERAAALQRQRLADATAGAKPAIARDLMQRLAALPWTAAVEDELLALVPLLRGVGTDEHAWEREVACAYRWLADRLLEMRFAHLAGPAAEREQLARAERRLREREARADAYAALAERFARASAAAAPRQRRWLEIERLCFAARAGADPAALFGEAAELLGAIPDDGEPQTYGPLRERAALVMAWGATRRAAPAELAERTLAFYRARRAAQPDGLDWRYQLVRLLIALDRPDELRAELRAWIVPGEVDGRWRLALGWLEAETGRLREAVALFERVAQDDELAPREHEALADWLLALGEDERAEHARFEAFCAMPAHELSARLYRDLAALSAPGGALPSALAPETLLAARALLHGAPQPAHHVGQLRDLYLRVKDFRLLASLADGVLGHSPEGVYPFLQQAGSILGEVHEEATCDELAGRIAALAGADESRTATDRRALQLLEAFVRRRACEVRSQPGQHVGPAVAALRAAFGTSWQSGERRLMAELLASLGAIPHEPLAQEQLRQLAELHRLEIERDDDRLRIAHCLAGAWWAYARHDAALELLAAALAEMRESSGGALPPQAREAVESLISWREARGDFGDAERFLADEEQRQASASIAAWYRERRLAVYVSCIAQGGVASLGRGPDLYRAARARTEEELWRCAPDRVATVLRTYCSLHRAAYGRGIGAAASDLAGFAARVLPELSTRVVREAPQAALDVASTLRDVGEPPAALAALVDFLEREPEWQRRVFGGGWQQLGWQVARLRAEVRPGGALGRRTLALAQRELRASLEACEHRHTGLWWHGSGELWAEHADAFAAIARDVARASADRPTRLLFVCRYLWDGLRLREDAVDALAAANRRGALDEDARWQLASWLVELQRDEPALAVLGALCEERPDTVHYATARIAALHRLGRSGAARAAVDAAEARWRANGVLDEGALAQLAQASLGIGYDAHAARCFEEAIASRQRTHPHRGVGDGTLCGYQGALARAYLRLGRPDAAVDAASAAVVSWGRDEASRAGAVQALREVLEGIDDLGAWIARRDAEVARTGRDAPLLRKLLGQVWLSRRRPEQAIAQLEAARALQPGDAETHRALVQAHELRGDAAGACAALLAAIAAAPLDLSLHADLARRFDALGRAADAERAWTGLVEAQPEEAEGHRMLAEQRERQGRVDEAITQWEHVVRVRRDEPEGWFALARARLRAGRVDEARRALDHLLAHPWEARFGDVRRRAAELLRGLPPPPR